MAHPYLDWTMKKWPQLLETVSLRRVRDSLPLLGFILAGFVVQTPLRMRPASRHRLCSNIPEAWPDWIKTLCLLFNKLKCLFDSLFDSSSPPLSQCSLCLSTISGTSSHPPPSPAAVVHKYTLNVSVGGCEITNELEQQQQIEQREFSGSTVIFANPLVIGRVFI